MKFGVSAKVFLAYAVLLVAFAATSLFYLRYLHGAREQVTTTQALLELRGYLENSSRNLLEIEVRDSSPRPDRQAAWQFARARDLLESARGTVRRFLADEPTSPRRRDFEQYDRQLESLETDMKQALSHLGLYLGGQSEPFAVEFKALKYTYDVFQRRLRGDSLNGVETLSAKEDRAREAAVFLGLGGIVVAMGAALLMWRTLRPLRVLGSHARQIAGGEYGRRIGLRSRDEIGDLAREFDAMAQALEEREQRLIRSERLATVGRIAAQITHEIRNPLASIGLNAELLGDELPSGGEGRRLLTTISREVDRLSEITESYLRFVRLPKPELEPEDPGALVAAVLEFTRAELAQAGISLELEVGQELPEIAADENQLRQALLNLVRNAREAMTAGGVLRVSVAAADGRLRLAVTDSGSGIAPQHVGKIFDPFFSTKEQGTGLGLALVQQIVNEHGGRIEVGNAPGGGTSFVITLPVLRRRRPGAGDGAGDEAAAVATVGAAAVAVPRAR
jgi:two-component system NtrC family sensor kinase